MKTHAKWGIVASILMTAAPPIQLAAQGQTQLGKKQIRYVVKALSTLGGTQGGANGVPNNGSVAGWSNLSGDQTEHAVLWRGQTTIDLGTLGGANSASGFPIKNNEVVAGNSQTSQTDPLNENFCTFSSYTTYLCRGFRWQDGTMTALPTLGGNNSWATVVNRRGQIAGFAETSTHDPSCIAPQLLDFEAVVWGPHEGDMQALPPFPGDAIGSAFGLNDKGQVVGASGICGSWSPTIYIHALLWQDGSVINLGSLGGQVLNAALFINNHGEVVGASDLPGDLAYHAFLWTKDDGMRDLGTLPGDAVSTAESINEQHQIVGASCDSNGNCRAALWQNGTVADLNSLVLPGTSLYLLNVSDINDRGEIAGYAYDARTGDSPGFLAIPCDAEHAEVEACTGQDGTAAQDESLEVHKIILPQHVRAMLQQRAGIGRR